MRFADYKPNKTRRGWQDNHALFDAEQEQEEATDRLDRIGEEIAFGCYVSVVDFDEVDSH